MTTKKVLSFKQIPDDKTCQYFKDDKGIGGDCYVEQNGKAKFREEFGVFFCDHHYQKLSEIVD